MRKVEVPSLYSPYTTGIDKGEIKVLALAKEIDADFAIIDEYLGRNAARTLDIPVKGTLGVLLIAYYRKLISKDELVKIINKLKNRTVPFSFTLFLRKPGLPKEEDGWRINWNHKYKLYRVC